MKELEDLAESVRQKLKLKYDSDSVKYLEGFIERVKPEFPKEDWGGLINSCGAFLGQCVIENFGGYWEKDNNGNIGIYFSEGNKVYPFARVTKQFENGLEDSIFSFFRIIPTAFKIEPDSKK